VEKSILKREKCNQNPKFLKIIEGKIIRVKTICDIHRGVAAIRKLIIELEDKQILAVKGPE
jgi:hypothetical protein